jgi:hypothetical protein
MAKFFLYGCSKAGTSALWCSFGVTWRAYSDAGGDAPMVGVPRVRPGGLFGPLMGMSQNVWVGELRYLVSVLGV